LFGHRVLVPPGETREQAQRLTRQLAENGFGDLLLFRSGEMKNGISLGVFSKKSNAEQQSDKALQLGIRTDLIPVYRSTESHFLLIRRNTERPIDLEPIRVALKKKTLPIQTVDCRAM
jgi:hypothetical protein